MPRSFLVGMAAVTALLAAAFALLPARSRTAEGRSGDVETAGEPAEDRAPDPPVDDPAELPIYEPETLPPAPPPRPGRAVGPDDPGDEGALAVAVLRDWELRSSVEPDPDPAEPPWITDDPSHPGGVCPRCRKPLTRIQPGMLHFGNRDTWSEWLACPRHGIYWYHVSGPGGRGTFRGPFRAPDWPRRLYVRRDAAAAVDRLREGGDEDAAAALLELGAAGAEEIVRRADPSLDRLRERFVRPVQETFRQLAERAAMDKEAGRELMEKAWEAPLLARDEAAACRARAMETDSPRTEDAGVVLAGLEGRLRDARWRSRGLCAGGESGHPGMTNFMSARKACARCGRDWKDFESVVCEDCLRELGICRFCSAPVMPGSRVPAPGTENPAAPPARRPPQRVSWE